MRDCRSRQNAQARALEKGYLARNHIDPEKGRQFFARVRHAKCLLGDDFRYVRSIGVFRDARGIMIRLEVVDSVGITLAWSEFNQIAPKSYRRLVASAAESLDHGQS